MIDWSTALLNSGYKQREMSGEGKQGGREGEDEGGTQRGVCMLASLREILVCKAGAEEEQVVKQQHNSARAIV